MKSDEIRSPRSGHHGRDHAPITEPAKSRFTPDPGEVPSPVQLEKRKPAPKEERRPFPRPQPKTL